MRALRAVAGLGAVMVLGACAGIVGIEDTSLAPAGGAGGTSGGAAGQPSGGPPGVGGAGAGGSCSEPIEPTLLFFANPLSGQQTFPLQVLGQSVFGFLEGALDANAATDWADRGHLVVDGRGCYSADVATANPPSGGYPSVLNGTFTFTAQSGAAALDGAVSFGLDPSGPNPDEAGQLGPMTGQGGIFGISQAIGTASIIPGDFNDASHPSSVVQHILIRPGYLSTLRMEPTPNAKTNFADGATVPDGWGCLAPGSATPVAGDSTLTVITSNFATQGPATDITFKLRLVTDVNGANPPIDTQTSALTTLPDGTTAATVNFTVTEAQAQKGVYVEVTGSVPTCAAAP